VSNTEEVEVLSSSRANMLDLIRSFLILLSCT